MDFTSRLALNKPNPDPVTGDVVDITKLNDNADKIDSVISFTICTSTARPSSPFQGQAILETDTGNAYVWGGSAWIPILVGNNIGIGTARDANSARKLKILQSGANGSLSNVLIEQTGAAAGSRALSVKAGGEANERWWIDYDGKMQWGPGTAGADVNLYRSAADTLKTDDNLTVVGNLTINGTFSGGRPVCILTKTVAQTLTHNVITDVTWSGALNSEANGDPFGMHAAGSTDVTIPVSGRWLLQANYSWATNATGVRQVRFVKNGVSLAAFNLQAIASFNTQSIAAKVTYLAAGDVIKVQAYQNSGGNLDILTSDEPTFAVAMLG